jgi:hypothetical protein
MRRIIIAMLVLSVMLFACGQEQTEIQNNSQIQKQNVSTPVVTQPVAEKPVAVETKKIACRSESDCGVNSAENVYCFQGNPVGDLYSWECQNAGTESAKCVQIHKSGLVAECGDNYFCFKGECIKYANCNDTDGGLNFSAKGKVLTNDNAIYEDKCDDKTVIEYYCSNDERAFSEKYDCLTDCSNGRCIEDEE